MPDQTLQQQLEDTQLRPVYARVTMKIFRNCVYRASAEKKSLGEAFADLLDLYSRGGVVYDPEKIRKNGATQEKKQNEGVDYVAEKAKESEEQKE